MKPRERTRDLIELGGLVVKTGLIELSGDDRTLLYGEFLERAATLRGKTREPIVVLWWRRDGWAFKWEAEARQQAKSGT